MSDQPPAFKASDIPPAARIGIAAARFNDKIVSALMDGCIGRLGDLGIDKSRYELIRVPGAFELPLAARALARTGRFAAVICLGAVVRGDTPHFEYVAGECARGVSKVSLSENLPVIFGVLTTNTEQQAWDRCGGKHGHAGRRAAEAALEMIAVLAQLKT